MCSGTATDISKYAVCPTSSSSTSTSYCGQSDSLYHYSSSSSSPKETLGRTVIASTDICVFEIRDTSSYSTSKFEFTGKTGTSTGFESQIYTYDRFSNAYTAKGALYAGDSV